MTGSRLAAGGPATEIVALPFTSDQFLGVFGADNEAVSQGVVRRSLRYPLARSTRVAVGVALVMFALLIYPAWSVYCVHGYPAMPTFGLLCPTTLFTIGLPAFLLGVWQDLGLLAAAVVGAVLAARSSVPAGRVLP